MHRPTGVSELYDLEKDPRETANLFDDAQAASLRVELMGQLLDWMVLTSDVTPGHTDSRGAPKFPYVMEPGDPWVADFLTVNGANN